MEIWNNGEALQLAIAVHSAQLCVVKFSLDGKSNSDSTQEKLYCHEESPQPAR